MWVHWVIFRCAGETSGCVPWLGPGSLPRPVALVRKNPRVLLRQFLSVCKQFYLFFCNNTDLYMLLQDRP